MVRRKRARKSGGGARRFWSKFGQSLGSAFVQAYDSRTGALKTTYPITITNPAAGMSGASCAAAGPNGQLYVIEPFVGVIRMDLNARNTQSVTIPHCLLSSACS